MADKPGNPAHTDPLKDQYREAIAEAPEVLESVRKHDTALLVIDLQYLDAAPGVGVFSDLETSGIGRESADYYFDRLDRIVLPNVKRLQDTFRRNELEVVHTRIMSLTQDGRDRSAGHKRLDLHAAPGSKEAEFLPTIAPVGDEIVINKTSSGVFSSTNITYVLRNLGITGLFIVGVYTNECVSTAVRDACDLGFFVTVIDDATATVTPDLQFAAIRTLKDRYARVMTTAEAIQEIEKVT